VTTYLQKREGGGVPVKKGHRNGVLVNHFLFFFAKIALCP
jgi:hypothetical protein